MAMLMPITIYMNEQVLLRGEKLIEKRGETHQLGGNFIVDK